MAYAHAAHPGGADDLATRRGAGLAPQVLPAAAAEGPPAVSWGAVLAGAAGAAALSLVLLILGTGLGLSVVSPWAQDGVRAATFGAGTIAWITLTQVAASALGGYLAGRLRSRWVGTQHDEVYFRDTAHGFLAWALSSLAAAALLVTAAAPASAQPVTLDVAGSDNFTSADVFSLTSASAALVPGDGLSTSTPNHFEFELPAYSVTVLVLPHN